MGCASSKQKRCSRCQNPMTRSYSMHAHQPPPQRHGDSYHIVAFSSSTLGSLKLENNHFDNKIYSSVDDHEHVRLDGESNGYVFAGNGGDKEQNEVAMGLIEAKTWSNMINERIPEIVPKTPIRTPPGEPETINVWEVMEGLDDVSPFRSTNRARSFSFDVGRTPIFDSFDQAGNSKLQEISDSTSPKPFWLKTTDWDPEVISAFRKSLEELPPDDPFHLRSLEDERQAETVAVDPSSDINELAGNVNCNVDIISDNISAPSSKVKDKVVVYFTSLRGVRKTYEDCCDVRIILKATGARVDERDVSMDSGFKQELKQLLGEGFNGGGLPKVFMGENYIGGADEIRRLHEDGQLEKLLERCEKVGGHSGVGGDGGPCEICGDVRFLPCETCSGSCKIYYEANIEEKEEEEEYGFQRCPDCNENGLIRCPTCCC